MSTKPTKLAKRIKKGILEAAKARVKVSNIASKFTAGDKVQDKAGAACIVKTVYNPGIYLVEIEGEETIRFGSDLLAPQ